MRPKMVINLPKHFVAADPDSTFESVIQRYRTAAGMNQTELAAALGTSRSTVASWESGTRKPDISEAQGMAVLLGIPANELLCLTDADLPNAHENALLRKYRQLNGDNQSLVFSLLDAMLEKEAAARNRLLQNTFVIRALESSAAAAGTGCYDNGEAPEPIFLKRNRFSLGADSIITVSGDSMEPRYFDGDRVYLKFTDDVRDGDDVVCVYHEGFIIKHYIGGELFSLNEARDFGRNHEGDGIRLIGKVLGIVEDEDLATEQELPVLQKLFHEELAAFDQEHGRI